MGGQRSEKYWASEMRSLFVTYRQFEELIPAENRKGAAHTGEDGRYVESILKNTLKKFLPEGIVILDGFILRAGVASGFSGKARKSDKDEHSSQLDLIIYDIQNYPVYQRFGDTAVVLPEGVLGIISVKKTLYSGELEHEIRAIQDASILCSFKGYKGPFLALVAMNDDKDGNAVQLAKKSFDIIKTIQDEKSSKSYDNMIGFIGNLRSWTIHKSNKKNLKIAEYQLYLHEENEEHLGLQFILKGILDVYYDEKRNHGKQPGFISFPKGKVYKGERLEIEYQKESGCR